MNKQGLRSSDLKKIENILFYAATGVRPPKKGLEKILDNLPVTDYNNYRYTSVMGFRIVLPLGIIAIALIAFLAFNNFSNKTTQQETTALPQKVTKQNVDPSLNQIDNSISNSMDQMDKDLQQLDSESNSSSNNDLNNL